MLHQIKIQQSYLIRILENKKSFEIRFNDRDYQVGDLIRFLPLTDTNVDVYQIAKSLGKTPIPEYEIVYIHAGLGMQEGYIAMSIKEVQV